MNKIVEKCQELNEKIHDRQFLNNFLFINYGDYDRVFTSLDVVEDCQDAINEFKGLNENIFPERSTLYVYGILQALYCQQDGIFHLHRTIIDSHIKDVYQLFEIYNFDRTIREVRDEIAGHPVDRKYGKEFYFIGKGSNSKYWFSYAGYTPKFIKKDVDLLNFIDKQEIFITSVLEDIGNEIDVKVREQILTRKDMKLQSYLNNLNHSTLLIYRGIANNNPLAKDGLDAIVEKLTELKKSLEERYRNEIPESIRCIFTMVDYILKKIDTWISLNELTNNFDAEIFLDSFNNQIDELRAILKEIDDDIEKVYHELSDPAHPVSVAMDKMKEVEEVRVIEALDKPDALGITR